MYYILEVLNMMHDVAYNFDYLEQVMVTEPSQVVVEIQKQSQHKLDVIGQHQSQFLVPDQQRHVCA